MIKLFFTIPLVFLLSACNTLQQWDIASIFTQPKANEFSSKNSTIEPFSFDWQLSGEKSIAPMQVFDNGEKIWLQFMPGQNVPAVFGIDSTGEKPIYFTRSSDYIILNGFWETLVFRGGHLRATAKKQNTKNSNFGNSNNIDINLTAEIADSEIIIANNENASVNTVDVSPIDMTAASFSSAKSLYKVSPADTNIRIALQRWARQAQWTFMPEHWNVDVDIPISAQASFTSSFQESVQDLISATELAERPLQPCFYSNNVLRIIPYTQSCNRANRG